MVEFKDILDEDEIVIKTYKPEKLKFYLVRVLSSFLISLFLVTPTSIGLIIDEDLTNGKSYVIIPILALIIIVVLSILLTKLAYNKRLYAYTNKRVLIQNGFIGIDYKSLDLDVIGASEVRVDFMDKLINRNTGTIKFGSQATPTNVQGIQAFQFVGIKDPYNVYREIKKHIDEVKKENKR